MTTKVRKAIAKKKVKRDLRKISPEDVKAIVEDIGEVAERKIEQGQARIPGATIDGMKIPWTRKDIEERFPIVELNSEETIQITWNGVTYQLLAGAIHYVPSVIRDSYLRHRRGLMESAKNIGKDSGFVTMVELGAGALPPEE